MRSIPSLAAAGVLAVGGLSGCGDGGGAAADAEDGRPQVVVTTNILGDIVANVLGDQADVEVVMPLGADPHDFAASARQAEAMEQADLLVINGAGFEEGLAGLIESAEQAGAPVFTMADHVKERTDDPHIWTDPTQMATATGALATRAAQLDGVDADVVESQAAAYVEALTSLDARIEEVLADVPADRRVLVTNHEVFGYFADRYGFEVVGAVIPSSTTNASAAAADIEALADLIRDRDVAAIFGETTQPAQLAEALADEVGGGIEVVQLFTESLGEDGTGAESYVAMMELNAERIRGALT